MLIAYEWFLILFFASVLAIIPGIDLLISTLEKKRWYQLPLVILCFLAVFASVSGLNHFIVCELVHPGKPIELEVFLQIMPMGYRIVGVWLFNLPFVAPSWIITASVWLVSAAPVHLSNCFAATWSAISPIPATFMSGFWKYTVPGGCGK